MMMIDRLKLKLLNWLTPRRLCNLLQAVSFWITYPVCVIAAAALIDSDRLALLVGSFLTGIIHVITKFAGYIDGQLDEENKVKLDPSKGKFAVVYHNDMPVGGFALADKLEGKAE